MVDSTQASSTVFLNASKWLRTGRGSTSCNIGSSGHGGGGGGSGRGGSRCGNSKWRTMQPLSPFSSLEALAKESTQKKEKAQKVYFNLRQQLLRNTNLDPIFSKSRSGTIANKNKKRITAITHCVCVVMGGRWRREGRRRVPSPIQKLSKIH